jgi:hypothetical protein
MLESVRFPHPEHHRAVTSLPSKWQENCEDPIQTKELGACLAVVCLATVSSGSPMCLNSAMILLVASFIMPHRTMFVGGLQMRPKPILDSFQLYIRPPPLA